MIKLALAAGYALDDLQNDVRWLDHASNRHPVDVRPGDRLVLTLDEIPSSGHSWRFPELPEGFVVLADSYDDRWEPQLAQESPVEQDPGRDEIAGDSSSRSFAIDITPAVPGGIYPLMLVKDRPWTSDDPIDEFEVLVSVSWASLHHTTPDASDERYTIRQHGPRGLWTRAAGYRGWRDAGSPAADRWLFTLAPDGQHVELDGTGRTSGGGVG